MNSNKGVTMVTVVVMIIVMLIIATVSIVAGNKIIINSNELKEEQQLQSVKAAILRKKTEVNMSGTLTPIGETYVGLIDPILSSTEDETIIATNWYLLDEDSLEKLGVYDVTTRYLVNYDYEEVLSTKDEDYIEKFMVIECINEYIKQDSFTGTALADKNSGDSSVMMKNTETDELFGDGWYVLKAEADGVITDFPVKYSKYIKNDYLVNFDSAQYIKITKDFEEI